MAVERRALWFSNDRDHLTHERRITSTIVCTTLTAKHDKNDQPFGACTHKLSPNSGRFGNVEKIPSRVCTGKSDSSANTILIRNQESLISHTQHKHDKLTKAYVPPWLRAINSKALRYFYFLLLLETQGEKVNLPRNSVLRVFKALCLALIPISFNSEDLVPPVENNWSVNGRIHCYLYVTI
jgi:hypothetical protein